jgi:hypothetical protein
LSAALRPIHGSDLRAQVRVLTTDQQRLELSMAHAGARSTVPGRAEHVCRLLVEARPHAHAVVVLNGSTATSSWLAGGPDATVSNVAGRCTWIVHSRTVSVSMASSALREIRLGSLFDTVASTVSVGITKYRNGMLAS